LAFAARELNEETEERGKRIFCERICEGGILANEGRRVVAKIIEQGTQIGLKN